MKDEQAATSGGSGRRGGGGQRVALKVGLSVAADAFAFELGKESQAGRGGRFS